MLTPAEEAGLKIGDRVKISESVFNETIEADYKQSGAITPTTVYTFSHDDGTRMPRFVAHDGHGRLIDHWYFRVDEVVKVSDENTAAVNATTHRFSISCDETGVKIDAGTLSIDQLVQILAIIHGKQEK